MKKILHSLLFFIALFCISSCELFTNYNEPVREYFDKLTNDASITSYTLSNNVSYAIDSSGFTCVPSESLAENDYVKVAFVVTNPQNYTLNPSISFLNLEDTVSANNVLIEQGNDFYTVNLSLPKTFLTEVDNTYKDLSSVISLYTTVSGVTRQLSTYNLALHCDSVPPEVTDSCVMVNTTDETYVLCFNMPKLAGTVHENDTQTLSINSSSWTFDPSATNSSGLSISGATTLSTSSPGTLSKINIDFNSGNGTESFPVYYSSGIALTAEDVPFEITFTDNQSLSSSVQISNHSKKLAAPTYSFTSGTTINQDSGKATASVTITAPALTEADDNNSSEAVSGNRTLIYEVTNSSTVIASGTATNSITLALPPGENTITATSKKSLYASNKNSATCTVNLTRAYVNANYTGSLQLGTITYPYKTTSAAKSALTDNTDTNNTIYLLSDETFAAGLSSGTVTICGTNENGNDVVRTIKYDGTIFGDSHDSNYKLKNLSLDSTYTLIYMSSGGSIALENCTLINGIGSGGGGAVRLYSGNLSMTDCVIRNCKTSSASGGAISVETTGATASLTNCIFENCSSSSNGGALRIGSGSASLRNCTITGCTATGKGNSIYLASGTLNIAGSTTIDSDIYLEGTSGDLAKITVVGALSGSTPIATITPASYTPLGQTILQSDSNYTLTASDCSKFAVTNDGDTGYGIGLLGSGTSAVGVLRKSGVSAVDIETVTFTPSATTFVSSSNPISTGSVSITVSAADSSNITVDLTDYMTSRTLALYQNGTEIKTNTVSGSSSACELSLAGLYLGTYQLKMSAVINGTAYSKQVNIEIKNPDISLTFTEGADDTNTDALQAAINDAPTDGTVYYIMLSGSTNITNEIDMTLSSRNIVLIPAEGETVTLTKTGNIQMLSFSEDATSFKLTLGSTTGSGSLVFQGCSSSMAILDFSGGSDSVVDIHKNVTIKDNYQPSGCGGSILVRSGTVVNLYGCSVQDNTSYEKGAAFEMNDSSVVNMYSGTRITGNTGPNLIFFNGSDSRFNWYGGTISDNNETTEIFTNESCVDNQSGNEAS